MALSQAAHSFGHCDTTGPTSEREELSDAGLEQWDCYARDGSPRPGASQPGLERGHRGFSNQRTHSTVYGDAMGHPRAGPPWGRSISRGAGC
jgi:hypothetical protein